MEKKFLKEIRIKNMAKYLLRKWWIVLTGCILTGGIAAIIMGSNTNKQVGSEETSAYVLENGNYVYSTLLNIRAEPTDEIISLNTYLGLIISNSSISAAIEELGLQESFIDIFNKMSWELNGENIKLKISSPLQSVDGHSWEEVLSVISATGAKTIMEYYDNVVEVRTIDEPYLENALAKPSQIPQTVPEASISKKRLLIAVMIGGILTCAGILIIFLLREDIMVEEEIEKNLDIPVLVTLDKKKVKTDALRR